MEQINVEQRNIGHRIKTARGLAGISRKDLESKFGISMHTLQSWELGRNPLTEKAAATLIEILHNSGVSCSSQWLLEGIGKSPTLLSSDFMPYPTFDKEIGPLFAQETSIQKEIEFFKTNNPNAIVIMVSDDSMEPAYSKGDFVGGIQYIDTSEINACSGQDCIVEVGEGIFFRRLMKRKDGYALACINPQTEIEEPVVFTKKILSATPVIWHRWKYNRPD